MRVPSRQQLVWVGRAIFVVIVAGLGVYLWTSGLDKADKLGSSIGCVLALAALAGPYLLPQPQRDAVPGAPAQDSTAQDSAVLHGSGDAQATSGGVANSGIDIDSGETGSGWVTRSGQAVADGASSVANTGIRRGARS